MLTAFTRTYDVHAIFLHISISIQYFSANLGQIDYKVWKIGSIYILFYGRDVRSPFDSRVTAHVETKKMY